MLPIRIKLTIVRKLECFNQHKVTLEKHKVITESEVVKTAMEYHLAMYLLDNSVV